jgi:hypothetical protein
LPLSSLERALFLKCSSLSSICIPSSIECICENCFSECRSLSRVTFESGSSLSCFERCAFSKCVNVASMSVRLFPSSDSNLILSCHLLDILHSVVVHHFHQFAFLRHLK